jgi:argininosuccinate synthase
VNGPCLRNLPGHCRGFHLDLRVRLKLYEGNIIVAGRKRPKSLYESIRQGTDSPWRTYDQSDATGFIRLNALRLKVRAALKSSTKR